MDVNVDYGGVNSLGGKEGLGAPVLRHQLQPVAGGVLVVQRPSQAEVSGAGVDGERADAVHAGAAASDAVVDLAVDSLVGVLGMDSSDGGVQGLVLTHCEPEMERE